MFYDVSAGNIGLQHSRGKSYRNILAECLQESVRAVFLNHIDCSDKESLSFELSFSKVLQTRGNVALQALLLRTKSACA